jgi:CelD/BcsL family acetyltransferase involved in cellulose biosynthesis
MPSATTRELRLEIRRGDAALDLLGRPEFREAWHSLHQACPWATAFQDAPFADVWYRSYRTRFAPVVVAGWSDATLAGLLLLAVSHDGTTLCHVGAHHAEYQVWLSTDHRFVGAALDALADTFPGRGLQLLFVPPGVEFAPPDRWRSRCFRRPISAPYLATNPADAVRSSLRKKSNRGKLGRLTRRGKFSFERVCDDAAFAALLDEIVPLYELRQGAAHDALPFRHDDLKRAFYLALQRETDLLHVTVMRVEDELIAAHIGMRSRNTVLAGMMAQSPRYAKQSAGKLLFFELALLLEQEGLDALDLPPGGEYKDRFATHFEEASTVTVLFSHSAAWRHRQQRRLIDAVKRRGVSTESVKRLIRAAPHGLSCGRPICLQVAGASRCGTTSSCGIYRFGGSRDAPRVPAPGGDSKTSPATRPPAGQPTTTATFLRARWGWKTENTSTRRERRARALRLAGRSAESTFMEGSFAVALPRRSPVRLLHASSLPWSRSLRLGPAAHDRRRRGDSGPQRHLHRGPRRQRALPAGHREGRFRVRSQLLRAAPARERSAVGRRIRRGRGPARTTLTLENRDGLCCAPRDWRF